MWPRSAITLAVALVVGCGPWPADGLRILAVEPIAGVSHWKFVQAVIGALTRRGHVVTAFTPFPDGDRDNYTEVDVSRAFPIKVSMRLGDITSLFNDMWTLLSITLPMGRRICDDLHANRRFSDIVARGADASFDAVLVEPAMWDCLSYVAAESGLPLIYAVPMSTMSISEWRTLGVVSNPAAVAPLLAGHAVPRTFGQRFSNAVFAVYENVAHAWISRSLQTAAPRPYDGRPFMPPSLIFLNGHMVSDPSRPVLSNVVNVGGIHLKPAGAIPQDILEFIEDSPNGVVLFTFGSTVAMTSIPVDILNAFKEALAQLPQRVLLKYEGIMDDKPNNVMTKGWFPQRDILLHPNVKLFISHGGISGMYEALDGGVPVLGFSLFSDQHKNIYNLIEWGMAISMDVFTVTKDSFLQNILELVNNKKYAKNAKIASAVFKDRPASPEELVVYWTEHVIAHKGAPYLKSHSLSLMWYEYFSLDVLGALLIAIFVVLYIISKTILICLQIFI